MSNINPSRDEIRLTAGLIDRFSGRFVLLDAPDRSRDQPRPVDVPSTNDSVALGGHRLDEFVAVPPDDPAVPSLEEVAARSRPLDPRKIVLLILCGGMSFRSGGQIHPLLPVAGPSGGQPRNLLSRRLDGVDASPLRESARWIVGNLFNETELRDYIQSLPARRRPGFFVGGAAPKLLPVQHASGPPLTLRTAFGEIDYNPAGHLEALRWLLIGGLPADWTEAEVVIVMSYSNWGRVCTTETLALAGRVAEEAGEGPATLMYAEVTPRPKEKKTGSLLVASGAGRDLRLVKYAYGGGSPRFGRGSGVLMSTHTLYFNVANLLSRLRRAGRVLGIPDRPDWLAQLLAGAADSGNRQLLSDLFEAALPVSPHLIPVLRDGAPGFLRVERDLDQLTLMPGPTPAKFVRVPPERAVTIKQPRDLEKPEKLRFLFES